MLKKKGALGLKPKAPIRRNAPGPSSQGPDRQPSKTPAPAATLSQTPVPESAPSRPASTSQTLPTNATVDNTRAPAVADGPVAAQDTQPAEATNQSKEPAASVATSKSTTESPSSQTDTEAATTQPPESAITTPSVAATPSTQPSRPTRRAAPQPRVPLPTAAPNAPTAPTAPNAPTRVSEASPSGIAAQVPTPASTTPQPIEPVQTDAATVATHSRAAQAATPPAESQTNIQESIEAVAEPAGDEPAAPPAKPKRAPRKRKAAAETAEADGEPAAPAPKRTRKKKSAAPAPADGEDQTEGDPPTEGEGSQQPSATAPRKRAARNTRTQSSQRFGEEAGGETSASTCKRGGGARHRSPTPEDAEDQKVDQSQVTMGDLVKDLRIGKKFSRHDELLERQRMKKLKSKAGGGGIPGGVPDGGSAPGSKAGTPAPAPGEDGEPSSSSAPARGLTEAGPQFQIIDGQIVVNTATLQFDRHAAAAREAADLEEEIEDDFTHHTTSATYLRRQQKPNHWNAVETETFYHGLRMFGTDFALLCKMFPDKNRRHVKLKFNREERAHPEKVNAALVGEKTVGIDLEEYKSHTGLEYKSVDEIEAEQARVEEEFEAEQRRVEEEALAEAKKREEELFGKKEEALEKKGRGRGRGRKKEAQMGMGF